MCFRAQWWGAASACVLMAGAALAQEAPLDAMPTMSRITPENKPAEDSILSTKKPSANAPTAAVPAAAPMPWQKAGSEPAKAASPFGATKPAGNALPAKIPFGRAEPAAPIIPSGPHSVEAAPVSSVDAVEVSEPAPPTPVAVGADPVAEDPALPTEYTSPMFDTATDSGAPRKIILRVLNKVTAQSAQIQAKPGEIIRFGQLEITAIMCRISAPTSPRDDAGLIDIMERAPDTGALKPLFRGWMYASSPSVVALEHPVYDVTMVECAIADPAPKSAEKQQEKPAKKAKN